MRYETHNMFQGVPKIINLELLKEYWHSSRVRKLFTPDTTVSGGTSYNDDEVFMDTVDLIH